MDKTKIGLVLEGGAMRGLFTAGVLDVFLRERLPFDGAVGVSAGAAFGCNFKSRQAGRVLRYNLRFSKDWRYHSVRSLLLTGDLYGADFCYRRLPEELDPFDWAAYEQNPMAFYAVCTNVDTGQAEYFPCCGKTEEIMKVFQASASMPLVSRAVQIGEKRYLDGGIADSIPLAFSEQAGFAKNVVILTQPRDYRKKSWKGNRLISLLSRKMPRIAEAMKERPALYNEQKKLVFQREREGRAFVIAPEHPLSVKRTERDPKKLKEAYESGKIAAEQALDALFQFLS